MRHAPTNASIDHVLSPHHLQRWRERLLTAILRVALWVGLVPAMLSVVRAAHTHEWQHAAMALLALAAVGAVGSWPGLPYPKRANLFMLMLYSLSVWVMLRVGVASQIYLLAVAPMATLLLSPRLAVLALLGCTATLVGVGWTMDLPAPLLGFNGPTWLLWLNLGGNFAFAASLITLSSAFLLRRLERTLAQQAMAAQRLRGSEERLRQIAEQVPGMVYRMQLSSDGRPKFSYVSPGAQALLGLSPAQLMADANLLHDMVDSDDRERICQALSQARETASPLSMEFRVRLADGTRKWLLVHSSPLTMDGQTPVRNGVMNDVSERKASEALVWQQANFDALTGLPNRRMLRDRLAQALVQGQRTDQPVVAMLIDIDHFKEVNDTLGHERGDQLLVEAARRIRSAVRSVDTVARMGGDEFAVVLSDMPASLRVDLIADAIGQALRSPFRLGTEQVYVSASIGISRSPDDAGDVEGLLKNVDHALYAAKDAGRNRFHHYTPALQAQALARVRLANDLRGALAGGQFHVVYQPIVPLDGGTVCKAEALLRWQHPERGPISPAEFIPIAESTGLIGEIGDWVFRTAVAQVRQWRATVHPQFQISVNRSPVQFRRDDSGRPSWGEWLQREGLPGQSIVVEITEGLLLDAGDGVASQLRALREAGLAVSLDDFGTGYSAMSYLHRFEIDVLKVDRSFVSGASEGETGRALCKAMIVMAHELGMKVVAEGVETDEQRDWLQRAGCDHAQGYLFARPMPPADFEAWLIRRDLPVMA